MEGTRVKFVLTALTDKKKPTQTSLLISLPVCFQQQVRKMMMHQGEGSES